MNIICSADLSIVTSILSLFNQQSYHYDVQCNLTLLSVSLRDLRPPLTRYGGLLEP